MSLNAFSGSDVLVCVWVLPLSALSGFFSGQVDAANLAEGFAFRPGV